MKGKIAFVLGAAVGYVLGTRAGRERYEQIKRGAHNVWQSEPVQRGVTVVKDTVGDRADEVKTFLARVGSDVLGNVAQRGGRTPAEAKSSARSTAAKSAAKPAAKPTAKSEASKASTAKGSATKSATTKAQGDA